MASYSRMVIMSMSEEDIKRVLTEERDSISDYAAFMMVEELKRRKELAESGEELSITEEESDLQDEQDEEGELPEDYEFVENIEDIEDVEELEQEDLDESLSDEQRAEIKRQRQIEELEKIKEDRKKTLILACVGTVVTALAIVGFMIYLSVSGQL
ncbi:MAG: hypothetical protein IJX59_01005 [Clostridia bacterium]|nr:hypothetical protein [Clostridia bacterium]